MSLKWYKLMQIKFIYWWQNQVYFTYLQINKNKLPPLTYVYMLFVYLKGIDLTREIFMWNNDSIMVVFCCLTYYIYNMVTYQVLNKLNEQSNHFCHPC